MGEQILNSSILQKAEELPTGFYVYGLGGNNYTDDDLPNDEYRFGSVGIFKRYVTSIAVVLFGINATITPLSINFYNGESWSGWKSYATHSDLQLDTYTVSKPANNDIFTLNDTFDVDIIKSGHVVMLRLNISGSTVPISGNMETLFTIPEKYRPPLNLIHNYISQQGDTMLIEILRTGEIQFGNMGKATNKWICRQCITYVTDK